MTKAVNFSCRKTALSWKKVAGANGYEIYCRTGSGNYKRLKTTAGTNVTLKGIFSKGERYCFKVRACRKVGTKKVCGAFSAFKRVTIKK